MGLLLFLLAVIYIIYMIFHDRKLKQSDTYKREKSNKRKHTKHLLVTRWWSWLLILALLFFAIVATGSAEDDSDNPQPTHKAAKVVHTQNLPGQTLDKSKVKKHEFYWTDKDNDNYRYFATKEDKYKITAIKVNLAAQPRNTFWCKAILANILHDNNLKFTNDKITDSDINLVNDGKYNIYSPKHKKWYWVHFAESNNNKVASFSIYPGKNDDAD